MVFYNINVFLKSVTVIIKIDGVTRRKIKQLLLNNLRTIRNRNKYYCSHFRIYPCLRRLSNVLDQSNGLSLRRRNLQWIRNMFYLLTNRWTYSQMIIQKYTNS